MLLSILQTVSFLDRSLSLRIGGIPFRPFFSTDYIFTPVFLYLFKKSRRYSDHRPSPIPNISCSLQQLGSRPIKSQQPSFSPVWDGEERCWCRIDGSDEAGAGHEVDCAGCYGWSVRYLRIDYCCYYQYWNQSQGEIVLLV